MGRPVSFDFTTGGGSPEEFLMGTVYLEPTLMHTIGNTVVLPDAPYPVKLVNGKAVHPNVAVSPAGPEPAWAYKVTIENELTGKAWSEFRGVPTGTAQIAYKDLTKFVTTIPPQTTAGMMQNWADTTEANADRSELAADRAEAPTDLMNKNLIENPASLTNAALSAAIDESAPAGFMNAASPAGGLTRLVADANYYDPVAFKYYSDAAKTIPATDNSPALQAMVNTMHANGGGKITMPRGKLAFRSKVIWKTGVSLYGAGKMVTRLCAEGVLFSLIEHGPEALLDGSSADNPTFQWYEDCTFSDFAIDNKGLSYTQASVDGKGLFLLYMKRAVFRDLVIVNTIGTGLGCDFLTDTVIDSVTVRDAGRTAKALGIYGYGGNSGIGIGTAALPSEPIVITNCFTYNCGNYGVFVETQLRERPLSMYAKISNCHSEGNNNGFGNKGSGATQFTGCTAEGNRSHGFVLSQDSFGDKILGGSASRNGEHGIFTPEPYGGDLSLTSVTVVENGKYGFYGTQRNANTYVNLSFTDCDISRNGWSGINADGAFLGFSLVNNRICNNGQASVNSITNRAFIVGAGSDKVTVVGNTICDDQVTKTQIVGGQIDATATNVLVVGNSTPGYTDADAFQLPSGTTFHGNTVQHVKYGSITIPDGSYSVYVNHFLGKIAESVVLTPFGDERVYVLANEANRIRIGRGANNTVGALTIMWSVTRTP